MEVQLLTAYVPLPPEQEWRWKATLIEILSICLTAEKAKNNGAIDEN